jgi:hypothetical protein
MAQTSPILRFALEVLHHGLENYASDSARHRKMAVLNLAQSVELAIKATLVENNVPIYEKGNRTIVVHEALSALAKLWNAERIDFHARVELLVDERNAIQHRYGTVDDVTLDYHMETAFAVLRKILVEEFDTGLDAWIRDNVAGEIWQKVRFVEPPQPAALDPSAAIVSERSATLDFIDGFTRYERGVREALRPFLLDGQRFSGSSLDLMIMALSNTTEKHQDLIRALPDVYRLRNRVIHGDELASAEDVAGALQLLDEALASLAQVEAEVLERALRASERGVRGTRLPTRTEEAQEEFAPFTLPPPSLPA